LRVWDRLTCQAPIVAAQALATKLVADLRQPLSRTSMQAASKNSRRGPPRPHQCGTSGERSSRSVDDSCHGTALAGAPPNSRQQLSNGISPHGHGRDVRSLLRR
ncbi:hypothetical protein KC19_VG006500, partial [Ceratodon purpureus]